MSFRAEREKAGMSATKVANIMGVSDAAVYMWESGETKPRTDKLVKLAAVYGCTVDDLLRNEPA